MRVAESVALARHMLRIDYPVLQAGMGSATSPGLVAAVSEGGGLGILGCLRRPAEDVERLVHDIRALTARPFGVNHVIAHLNGDAFQVSLDARVPVISTAWGDPGQVVAAAHEAGSIVVHQVNTVAEAVRARDAGVDVIVAQGGEGGGHVGRRSTLTLLPEIVDAIAPSPVIAAGGISDERAVAAAVVLGAAGVLMGTRFLATAEAPVAQAWKQAVIGAGGDDTVASNFYDAMRAEAWPGAVVRTLRNRWTDDWADRPEAWAAAAAELRGEFMQSFAAGEFPMAGEGAGLVHDIASARDLPRRLWEGAEQVLRRFSW